MECTFIFVGGVELSYEMEIVIGREAIKVEVLESHVKCYELLIVNASVIISPRLKPRTHGQANPNFSQKNNHISPEEIHTLSWVPLLSYACR